MESAESLAAALQRASLTLVVTGAGISRPSGIPTFRGSEPGAIWKESDVSMATRETFENDPVAQWKWYFQRFETVDGASPNAAHRALVELAVQQEAAGGSLRIVTQNIDTLHEQAGSADVIKVHGTADRLRCSAGGCEHGAPRGSIRRSEVDLDSFRSAPSHDTLPRCPACQGLLRAHVLFFDEFYQEHADYRFSEVQRLAAEASLALFIGTSFSVGVTDLILRAVRQRGRPVFSIDPFSEPLPGWMGVEELREPAESVLPRLLEVL